MPAQRSRLAVLVGAVVLVAQAAIGREPDGEPRFVVETTTLLSQAPDWLDRRNVVWFGPVPPDEGGDGQIQIFSSNLERSDLRCLTCGLDGPNQVPVVQPHGPWILFHSWNGHAVRIGGPGFGGIGSDIWVMRRDGTQRTNLTRDGELHDNFHAYWSPDGRYVAWTALDWDPEDGGNGRSDVRVARFDPHGPGGPRLVDEHVVRPGNGHWYETQWWAPDGSGFLYTETVDTAINPELFFCRLPDPARGECRPRRLTRDPAWDEQAIFTPDMKRILFMSSRNLPGAHNDWAIAATLFDLPAEYDYELILPVFSDSFLQPIFQQATDLYEITLRWNRDHTRFKPGPVRRLTHFGNDGWVIPEFAWDPTGHRLLWTQNKFATDRRVDQGCVIRELRSSFIGRLSGVNGIAQVPFDLGAKIRDEAARFVQEPRSFSYQGACGSTAATTPPRLAQESRIAQYE